MRTQRGPRAARYLYLTRHGEAVPDESELSDRGRSQAALLGRRLRDVPLAVIHHGPSRRTAQTARLIGEQLSGVPEMVTEVAGDYVPHAPDRSELPAESADLLLGFLDQLSVADRDSGASLARDALDQLTGPVPGSEPRHELVVTHNFLIGWLVGAAQDAPDWRWMGVNHCNSALTVIRYAPGRPNAVLTFNDQGHLPSDLRWTGFPLELRA